MNPQNKLKYPLNFNEIQILNPDAKIITYDELNDIKDIRELFKKSKKIIILYLLESKYIGHYTCLFLNKYGINYFDSYGEPIDYFLDILTKKQRKEWNEKEDKLKELLLHYRYIWNNYLLQGPKTDTCGQFVTHRLHNFQLSEEDYIDKYFINSNKSPDIIVADYCLNLLKNYNII
jgi:hypothetical protein